MNNFKFSDDLKEAIQYGLCIFCIIGAMVMSFLAMYIEPQGELSNSVLVLIAQVLVFCGSLLGINTMHNIKLKSIGANASVVDVQSSASPNNNNE